MKLSTWAARVFAVSATFALLSTLALSEFATLLFFPGFTFQVSDLPQVQTPRCYPTEPEPSSSPTPSPAPKSQLV